VVFPLILAAIGVFFLFLGPSVSVQSVLHSLLVMNSMLSLNDRPWLPYGCSFQPYLLWTPSQCLDSCGKKTHMQLQSLWLVAYDSWVLQTHRTSMLSLTVFGVP